MTMNEDDLLSLSNLLVQGMVLRMKFLRTMCDVMTREDLELFHKTCANINSRTISEEDLRNLSMLYGKFKSE